MPAEQESVGAISVLEKTYPVRLAGLQIVTRPAESGNWQYLFLYAASAETGGVGFSIDCYGLRPTTTLAHMANARIRNEHGECSDEDTISDGEADSLVDACTWTIEDESTGEDTLWMFHTLHVDF